VKPGGADADVATHITEDKDELLSEYVAAKESSQHSAISIQPRTRMS
jgi:hypothetical protein